MAVEDRASRPPVGFRPGPDEPFEPFGPPLPAPPVRRVPARGPRRGTAVLVPPWKIRSTAVLAGWTRALAARGLETWIPVPPFHLERTPPGERPGEGMVGPDLERTRASLEVAVREVRGCLARAADAGGRVALVGLSLGGLVGAWAACAPERVDAAVLVAPPADLFGIFRETPIGRRYATLAARAGAPIPGEDELGRRLAWLAPLDRRPTADRVLVVGGRLDAVAPGGAEALAHAWHAPLRLHDRGHLTLVLACPAAWREAADLAAGTAPTSSPPAVRP